MVAIATSASGRVVLGPAPGSGDDTAPIAAAARSTVVWADHSPTMPELLDEGPLAGMARPRVSGAGTLGLAPSTSGRSHRAHDVHDHHQYQHSRSPDPRYGQRLAEPIDSRLSDVSGPGGQRARPGSPGATQSRGRPGSRGAGGSSPRPGLPLTTAAVVRGGGAHASTTAAVHRNESVVTVGEGMEGEGPGTAGDQATVPTVAGAPAARTGTAAAAAGAPQGLLSLRSLRSSSSWLSGGGR